MKIPSIATPTTPSPTATTFPNLTKADEIKLQPELGKNASSATRILEPVSKNVDSIEAARVLNVYDTAATQIKILMNLSSINEFLKTDTALFDLAVKSGVKSYVEVLLELQEKLSSNASNAVSPEETLAISEQISAKAKNLCRALHHHIELETVIIAYLDMNKTSTNQTIFTNCMDNLKIISSEKLRTLPSEEVTREKYLIKISKKQQQNTVQLKKLEAQLAEDQSLKEKQLNTLQEELRKLKSDLYQLEQFTDEQIRRTKNEIDKQTQSDSKNSEQRQKKLRLETKDLQIKHAKMQITNMSEEEQLRRKKANIEKQIEDWIEKYDNEAGELQKELDKEGDELSELTKQHDKLQVGFETLAVDYNKIMEERRIENEKMEREQREIEEKTGAAEVIQAFFRSYKVRKAMKKKGKKGKGKGKK